MDGSIWRSDTADLARLFGAALPSHRSPRSSTGGGKSKCNCFFSSSCRELMGSGRRRPSRTARRQRDDPSFPGRLWQLLTWLFLIKGPIKKLISMRERGGGRARADCIQLHAHCDSSGGLSAWCLLEAAKTLRQPEDEFLLELQMGLRLRGVTSRTETSSFRGFCTQHLLFISRMNSAPMMSQDKLKRCRFLSSDLLWDVKSTLVSYFSCFQGERLWISAFFDVTKGGNPLSPVTVNGCSSFLAGPPGFCCPFQTCGLSN